MNRRTESSLGNHDLEARLRAHFADRTEREPLPGRPDDETLAELVAAHRAGRRAAGSDDGAGGDAGSDVDAGSEDDAAGDAGGLDAGAGAAGTGLAGDPLSGNHDEPLALASPDGSDGEGGESGAPGVIRLIRRRPLLLAAAAAVVLLLVAVGLVVADGDEPGPVVTDPTPTPTGEPDVPTEDEQSPTTVPETTPSTDPTTTTSEPEPPPADPAASRIVGVEGILGTWTGTEWVSWEAGTPAPDGGEYLVVRLDGTITRAVGTSAPGCGSPDPILSLDLGLELPAAVGPVPIAVTGVDDPMPRPVDVLGPSDPDFVRMESMVRGDMELPSDPALQVEQVIRADIDGDGTVEYLITAERSTGENTFAGSGDYSMVVLQHVVGGQQVTEVIASSVDDPGGEAPFVEWQRVSALADLNGDGTMEIVLSSRYYEGSSTVVHELRPDGIVPEVLRAGCGA